jgi:hypothetical protein
MVVGLLMDEVGPTVACYRRRGPPSQQSRVRIPARTRQSIKRMMLLAAAAAIVVGCTSQVAPPDLSGSQPELQPRTERPF